MATHRIVRENPEERLIFGAIAGSWALYAIGGLYVAGPVLAMLLLGKVLWRHAIAELRPELRPHPLPAGVWAWLGGMTVMLVALLVAHIQNDLGLGQTLKSSIGWLKGWALLALFPLAGAALRIRPDVVIRACSWFGVQTLLLIPFMVLAAFAHLPSRLFVSPLQIVGGPGPEYFAVYLYIVDPLTGGFRWQFIAPWAPAAGMLGNLLFVLACFERDRRFQVAGLCAGVLMALMTQSRMAILFVVLYPPLLWTLSRLSRPWLLAVGAALSTLIGVVADAAITVIGNAVDAFRSARANSTRVREDLGRIALERWWDDAPVWGHGVVERGPHFVEFMPIGSHHTWYGLLYVKGIVGLLALALPMLWTAVELLLLAQVSRLGRLGLSVCLILVFYSFGENLEALAYLFWPGLIVLGIALGGEPSTEPELDSSSVAYADQPSRLR
jgi:hypothetical protein